MRAAYDPQLAPLLELFAGEDLHAGILARARAQIFELTVQTEPPAGVVREERLVPGPAGAPDVRLVIWRPQAAARGTASILHIHGGGCVMGAPEMNDARNAQLAATLAVPVVSVDYRLAPETVAPGNVEDCYAGLAWLNASAAELGVDPRRTVVLGESAGGLFAAALALLARDRGEYAIAYLALIYPMLDDRTVLDERPNAAGELIWTKASNRFGWDSLLSGRAGAADVPEYAVPARAKTLAGLPPTFISVGALDLFVEENLTFAARLAREGVPVELHLYPGAFHAFDMMMDAEVAQQFRRDLDAALRRAVRAPAA